MRGFTPIHKCPMCNSNSFIVDVRTCENGLRRRRRACIKCSCRWSTYEIVTDDLNKLQSRLNHLEEIINMIKSIPNPCDEDVPEQVQTEVPEENKKINKYEQMKKHFIERRLKEDGHN